MTTSSMPRPSDEAVVRLVEAATQAPSSHNSQPWRFRVADGAASILADRTRQLSVTDPDGRELVISCGAALFTLLVAAHHEGFHTTVERLPAGQPRNVLVTVALSPGAPPAAADLSDAIGRRHTTRAAMRDEDLSEEHRTVLVDLADAHGARLHLLDSGQRTRVAQLIAAGDEIQFADRSWRTELASWMHPRAAGDGLTVPPVLGRLTRLVVTHTDLGKRTAAKDRSLAESAPVLAVLCTPGDDLIDWLHAGEALQHVLLRCADLGFQAGHLNQPCQVAQLRRELRDLLGREGWPQLVLRIGRPVKTSPSAPRRNVSDVIDVADPPSRAPDTDT